MSDDSVNQRLGAEKYVLLTTYRKTGVGVPTPVWGVPDDGGIAVWTVANSGKVKRIRNNPAISLAPCTMRGRPLGPAATGTATILDQEATGRVRRRLARKYWILGPLTLLASRIRRGTSGTVGIRIHLDAPAG